QEWSQSLRQEEELPLDRRLGREVFARRGRDVDGACQPGVVVTGVFVNPGIEEDVVGIDQGDDQEKGLLRGSLRGEVGEHPLVAGLPIAVVVHEPAVVVWTAATSLVDVLIGTRI